MSTQYVAVQWNAQKKRYDGVMGGAVFAFLATFIATGKLVFPTITDEILILRALGTCAFLLLHVVLSIGPLCRLSSRFLPLLYNRRHAGVLLFFLALLHAVLVIITYHAGGNVSWIHSWMAGNALVPSVAGVPFQFFGFAALMLLTLMAVTSHDFWLRHLTAPIWKALHMGVYAAYALLVLHVAFGVIQRERSMVYPLALTLGATAIFGVHWASARHERHIDGAAPTITSCDTEADEFQDVCALDEIRENRAKVVMLSGERVAVFRYEGKVSAVSNVCQHQNGPLGEGKIVNGCITCPWHGYQYLPDTGASPPPFVEKIPTFEVRLRGGRVLIHPTPRPAGTRCDPALISPAIV